MKSRQLTLVVFCSAIAVAGTTALAAFEPLFQVTEIKGECTLKRPKEKEFTPAVQAKAYPYGTKIKTGKNSSLLITLSKGNTCRVLAGGSLSIGQGAINSKHKSIRLNDGEVEVTLKNGFDKGGYSLDVATAAATFGAEAGKFRVASKTEQGLRIIIARVLDGSIGAFGEDFLVKSLKKDNWLSLLIPPDRAFIRLKNMKGTYTVTVKDKDMQNKDVPTETGSVLKIWRHEVPETRQNVVTVVITDPKGKLVETYTVTYKQGTSAGFAPAEQGTGESGKTEIATEEKGSKETKEAEHKKPGKRGNPVVHHDEGTYVPDLPSVPEDIDPNPAKTPTPVGKR